MRYLTLAEVVEIDVLHPHPSALEQTQAGAMQQDGHEAGSTAELTDHSPYFVAGGHNRQSHGLLGSDDVVEPGQIPLEDGAIEEQKRTQCLVLCGRGDVAIDGQ